MSRGSTMTGRSENTIVLGFPSYRAPAARLAQRLGARYGDVAVHRFPDGESLVRLPPDLPGHVVLCLSLDHPNGRLVELELAAATARELGAETLTLVAPYLCYMRQDKAFHPGEAVSQRIVGALLGRRFDALITVDPHLHRTHTLAAAIPVRRAVALSAAPVMTAWLEQRSDAPLLIGPDEESSQWVSAIANPAGLDYGIALKTRLGDREVRVELPDVPAAGRDVVLVDDVASTGQTLVAAAREVRARGAASIAVLVTHALFVDDAEMRLREAGVTEICSSDSIPHPSNRLHLDEIIAAAL